MDVPDYNQTKRPRTNDWPKTSDKEFSKRMFIVFMWAFFVHIVLVIIAESFLGAEGAAIQTLKLTVPVYSTIFAAVIVKGGVENVFKGLGANGAPTVVETECNNG